MATHTIPLRRAFLLAPRNSRAKKAVSALRKYVEKHTKVSPKHVILGEELNEAVWARGMTNPPSKISVEITTEVVKTDTETYTEAYVNLVGIKRKKKVDIQKKGVLGKQTLKDKLSGAMEDLKGKKDDSSEESEESVEESKEPEAKKTPKAVEAEKAKTSPKTEKKADASEVKSKPATSEKLAPEKKVTEAENSEK